MGRVDRLAEIRREIRVLQAEAKLIRQRIIAGLEPVRDQQHYVVIMPHVVLHANPVTEPAPSNGAYSYAD